MANEFQVPVLLLIFNRPDTTRVVFNKIKNIKPYRLFIAGDGPRGQNEEKKVEETRGIISEINWDCKVETLFRRNNLGCKSAVSSAIDWFFENNPMGIILEDDCDPHPSFFNFCSELLHRFNDEEKVMQISGFNPLGRIANNESYYFAKFGPIWGWATWKRAWKYYDVTMKDWKRVKEEKLYRRFCDSRLEELWRVNTYDKVANGLIDTWDYQWSFTKFIRNGLSIIPSKNLVKNIGFGTEATHTGGINIQSALPELYGIDFPLKHPVSLERNKQLDKKFFNNFVIKPKLIGIFNRLLGK